MVGCVLLSLLTIDAGHLLTATLPDGAPRMNLFYAKHMKYERDPFLSERSVRVFFLALGNECAL